MNALNISPRDWRKGKGWSMAKVAAALGMRGKNPASTWCNWESGKCEPPISVVMKIEIMSDRQVTAASWFAARQAHLEKKGEVSA